jgi:type IV pilus assembly protein PilE
MFVVASTQPCASRPPGGFTLIEVMITVAIVALLATVALPSFSAYLQRSRVPVALDNLSAFATRMEQRYQDTGNYGGTACGVTPPAGVANFTLSCTLSNSGQGYTASATGAGSMAGHGFTINHLGVRATTAHPRGLPPSACWTTRGATCDT